MKSSAHMRAARRHLQKAARELRNAAKNSHRGGVGGLAVLQWQIEDTENHLDIIYMMNGLCGWDDPNETDE